MSDAKEHEPKYDQRTADRTAARDDQVAERDESRNQHRYAAQQGEPRPMPLRREDQPQERRGPPRAGGGEQHQQVRRIFGPAP
jgi:hypothetical protein